MHFGEYELSPSLIGLSLLPSPHPEAFQRFYWCGPPSGVTRTSSWTRVDHLVSRLPVTTQRPVKTRFRFGCGTSKPLTLLIPATRRFIMQKARRHSIKELRPLVGVRFQELFHSSTRGAFHLSLTVLVRYRSLTSI